MKMTWAKLIRAAHADKWRGMAGAHSNLRRWRLLYRKHKSDDKAVGEFYRDLDIALTAG